MVEQERVDGDLALSRAFGDFHYKDRPKLKPQQQAVTCYPDILVRNRSDKDQFIMLACDGIWDCLTNKKCIDSLTEKIATIKNFRRKSNLSNPLKEMFKEILVPDTNDEMCLGTDNMTAVLIYFPKNMGITDSK